MSVVTFRKSLIVIAGLLCLAVIVEPAGAQKKKKAEAKPKKAAPAKVEVEFPPKLPDGKLIVTDTSPDFLKATTELKPGVTIAKTPPTVDFMYYPGQTYEGKPWSNWGDSSVAANGKYYSAFGDHLAIGSKGSGENGTGTAFVFEYDPATKALREICNTSKVLNMPEGHYTPGKIHTRVDVGSDGNVYFATHRGSPKAANDANHYTGDWIFRCNPKTGKTDIVVQAPVAKHSIPNGMLDPDRLIYYGGTAAGPDAKDQEINFFAYDCKNNKLLYAGPGGPSRYMMLAKSTGRLYFVPEKGDGPLMRYDPAVGGAPVEVKGVQIGIRSATEETPQGFIYTISLGQGNPDAEIWSFNTKTEQSKKIGIAAVGSQGYIASLDVDPTGRYLYYNAGAHGSSDRDGTPIVQFDLETGKKKVIAFLHPFYQKYGLILKGTYGSAIDPKGEKLFVTWNVSRNTKNWDSCGMTVIHIPESER